jgi:hypothetical protein
MFDDLDADEVRDTDDEERDTELEVLDANDRPLDERIPELLKPLPAA